MEFLRHHFHVSNLSCNTFLPIYSAFSSRREHYVCLGTVVLKCHLQKEHWSEEWNKQEATESKQPKDLSWTEHGQKGSLRPTLFLISAVLLVSFSLAFPWLDSSDGTLLWLLGDNAVQRQTVKDTQIVDAIDALFILLWHHCSLACQWLSTSSSYSSLEKSLVGLGACSTHLEQAETDISGSGPHQWQRRASESILSLLPLSETALGPLSVVTGGVSLCCLQRYVARKGTCFDLLPFLTSSLPYWCLLDHLSDKSLALKSL